MPPHNFILHAGDMTNPSAQLNTFMFSNIAPHYQDHNTGEISITFVQRDSQVSNILLAKSLAAADVPQI